MRLGSLLLSALLLLTPALAQDDPRIPRDPAAGRELAPFTIPPAREGEPYLRVLAMGDWGSGTADQARIASGMATHIRERGCDLVVTTGDNFYPRGVASVDDPHWQRTFERVYAAPELQVPWWPSLGNHDHAGNIQAQIDYSQDHPRWRMPARYHRFSRPLGDAAVDFFVLDTTPLRAREGDAPQLAWIAEQLAASTARWKVVYGHHPIYSNGSHGDDSRMKERLEPLLVRAKVDLYLAGHDHTLELRKPVQGVVHLVSGSAGGKAWAYPVKWTDDDLYASTGGGFVGLRFSKDELVIELVRSDGHTEWAWALAKGRVGPF